MKKKSVDALKTEKHFFTTLCRVPTRLLANSSLRQNMLLLLANVLAGGFAYLLHPLLARLLSIQEYGEAATFIALALVLSTLTQTIATVAAQYTSALTIGENGEQFSRFLSFFTLVLLAVGVAATLLFAVGSASLVGFFHLSARQEVLFLSLIFLTLFAMPLNQGTFQGLQLFGWYALITLLVAFLRLFFSLALVLVGLGVDGVILGVVSSLLLTYMISFWPLRRLLRWHKVLRSSLGVSCSSSALLALLTTGAVSLGLVILSSLDTMLARHFLPPTEAGLYAALATIGRTVLFVTSGIAVIMFPKIVVLHARSESYIRLAGQTLLGVLALSLVAELLFCLAPVLLTRLLFGSAFLAIAGLLPFYGLAMLFLACTQTLALYFLAIGQRAFALVIAGACLLEIGLISWHHTSVGQLVLGVLLANAALVLALWLIWVRSWQTQRTRFARQERVY